MKIFLPENRKKLAALLIAAVCAALTLSTWGMYLSLAGMLRSQHAAEAFRGGGEMLCAQASAFFPVGGGIDFQRVYGFRGTIDAKYVEASLEKPEVGSLYKDGYSCKTKITVSSPKTSIETTVYGVGGEYFYFHPLLLRSGSYIAENDLTHDGVIIDEELAWKLFGGVELQGLDVMINERLFRVAGVIHREDDFATKSAYSDGTVMYMQYDALNEIQPAQITAYEIVGADPIDGFLKKAVSESFSEAVTVENSARFSPLNEFEILKKFFTRAMVTEPVVYPYWENAARLTEGILAFLLVLGAVFPIYPVIFAIYWFVRAVKAVLRSIRVGVPIVLDRISERRYERRLRKKAKNG